MPPRIERILLAGPAGALEACIEQPDGTVSRYAVICHPHPLYGGTMENKVVTTVARALHDSGVPTIRFNFRGVGGSEGVYDAGDGETDDAAAVAACGAERWPGARLVVAGFSFGAFVALRLARRVPAVQLITIAPPVERFDFSGLGSPACPWLIVQGDADEVVEPSKVLSWAATLEPKPQIVVMTGVGHFFHGRLNELRQAVAEAARSH